MKTMRRRKIGKAIAPDRAPMICGNGNGAAAVKAAAASKSTVKRRRSYAPEKGAPVIAVREESRAYPEGTNRLIEQLGDLRNHQTALPRIARDAKLTALIEKAVHELPTNHDLYRHDARDLSTMKPESVSVGITLLRDSMRRRQAMTDARIMKRRTEG